MKLPSINSIFTGLESNPVIEVMSKEILGINLPKTAIVRSSDEMVDVAFNEAGNTIGFFGGGFALQWLLDRLPENKQLEGILAERSQLWRQTGKSIAIASVLFSLMWAMPFLRNYLTAVRTGTDDYTQVIGSKASGSAGSDSLGLSSDSKQQRLEEHKQGYLTTAFKTIGIGLSIALAGLIGSRVAIRKGIPIGKELVNRLKTESADGGSKLKHWLGQAGEWTRKTVGLKDGKFKNFSDIHAALFWGLPAYGGWIAASRDGYEKKEQVLKAANFFIWFFALPALIRRRFVKKYPKKLVDYIADHNKSQMLPKIKRVTKALIEKNADKLKLTPTEKATAISLWKKQSLTSWLASIVFLGVSPSILNIWLTKRRIADAHEHQTSAHQTRRPSLPSSTSGSLQRKSFESFVLHQTSGQRYNDRNSSY